MYIYFHLVWLRKKKIMFVIFFQDWEKYQDSPCVYYVRITKTMLWKSSSKFKIYPQCRAEFILTFSGCSFWCTCIDLFPFALFSCLMLWLLLCIYSSLNPSKKFVCWFGLLENNEFPCFSSKTLIQFLIKTSNLRKQSKPLIVISKNSYF